MLNLTKQDLDLLLDSLDAWETHDAMVLQSHDAMRSMYTDKEQRDDFDRVTRDKRQELISGMKTKRDQGIILRFKIVKMKESIDADIALTKLSKENDKKY